MTGWVDKIGPYNVVKKEGPRPSGQPYLKLNANPSFCVHTTEGSTVDGAVATLRKNYSCPHFVVGEGKIVQMRPLWSQGATLRSHNDAFIQVECVGHSSLSLHTLSPSTWGPLVALTRWVNETQGVPLKRPDGWDDKLGSGIWAANNVRRQSRLALKTRGVFGHVDIPDQDPSWHWDPGSLNYTKLFAEAKGTTATPEGDEDQMYKEFKEGVKAFKKGEPLPDNASEDFTFGWKFAEWTKDEYRLVRKKDGA